MNFTVKHSDVMRGLQAALSCSIVGVKREYPDAGRITIEASESGLKSYTNNGNVAVTNTNSGGDSYRFVSAGAVTVKTDDFSKTLESFDSDEVLTFSLENNELIIRPLDPEQFQTLPTEVRQIVMPNVADKFDKELNVKRDILINCMKKVAFAIGFEKFKPEFLYWVMRFTPKGVRAVCGDGARIAVYELEGENVCDGKKSLDVAIHRDHNPVLEKLLAMCSASDTVAIREYARNNDDDPLMSQTVVSGGDITMVFIGHDPGIKWPDENRFLNMERNYRFTLRMGELNQALKGALATYNQDVRKNNELHVVGMTFDLKKKVLALTTSNTMRANRKVNLADVDGPSETLEFKCLSGYLNDAVKNGDSDGLVQVELASEKGPAFFRFYAGEGIVKDAPLTRTNASAGTKEQYTVFFAGFNKKK